MAASRSECMRLHRARVWDGDLVLLDVCEASCARTARVYVRVRRQGPCIAFFSHLIFDDCESR